MKDKFWAKNMPPFCVSCPPFGELYVRRLTVRELRRLRDIHKENDESVLEFIASAVVNEDNTPVFESVAELDELPAGPILDLAAAIAKANSPGTEEQKKS